MPPPQPSDASAFTAHSGQTVDGVTGGGCRERLGPYHCPAEEDDQYLEEREEDVELQLGLGLGLTGDQHLGRNVSQGGGDGLERWLKG